MKRLFMCIAMTLGFACDGAEKRDLPVPAFSQVGSFDSKRYLADHEIAKSVLEGEGRSLANQLLGIREVEPALQAAPRRPVRRVRRVETYEAEDDWEEEEVHSGLSDFAFQDAIHAWRGVKQCVAAATKRANQRSGAIRVSFRIRGDGGVAESKVVDTSNAIAQAVAPCVARRARRIRFPAFGGDDDVTKVAKFVF